MGYLECIERINSITDSFSVKKFRQLKGPSEFYQVFTALLKASESVYIQSLYMGDDEWTLDILCLIRSRVTANMKTLVVLDAARMQRMPAFRKKLDEMGISNVFKFHSGLAASLLPYKLQELFRVLHSKVYIFDNKLLISGANVDASYFTTRLDRYIVVESHELTRLLVIQMQNMFLQTPQVYVPHKLGEADFLMVSVYDAAHEISILDAILKDEIGQIFISTGYLNFTQPMLNLLKNVELTLITGSHTTCAVYKLGFIGFLACAIYKLTLEQAIKKLNCKHAYIYNDRRYTFHQKGVWVFFKEYAVTIVGSSNYNSRSQKLDSETNFVLITRNSAVIQKLKREVDNIMFGLNIIKRSDYDLGFLYYLFYPIYIVLKIYF